MKKNIREEELLFDVKDVITSKKKIILGNNLHIPDINPSDGLDWSVESLLMAMEIAMDNGVKLYEIPSEILTWKVTYYCRINGQTYHVTEENKKKYGGLHYKIELV